MSGSLHEPVNAVASGPAAVAFADIVRISPPKTEAYRNPALDIAKGIAIISVVMSHVMRGAHNDSLVEATLAYRLIDTLFYLFHVQLFLLISGYLAFPRAAEPQSQRNRQISLAYAYFLWSGLSLAALIVTHDDLPAPDIARSILALFYAPIQHFWFLPVIMIGFALLYGLRTRLALAIAIAICLLFPAIFGFSYYGLHYYLPFYLLGAWLRLTPITLSRPRLLTAVSVALLGAGVCIAVWYNIVPPMIPALIPFSLAGCYAVYRGAQAFGHWAPGARALKAVGQASLPIFLTHIFFTAGARRASVALLGHVEPGLILAFTLLVGIVGPILLDHLAQRLNLQRLAGFTPLLK